VRVAIDTNRYTDFARGDEPVLALLEQAEAVYVPFVVLAELRAGFALGTRGRHNERVLRRFCMRSGVEVLYADDETISQYVAVYRQLRQQGTPIPTNDMWIAALVLQHDLTLLAREKHFDELPQIPRV
jgi:tRNA(fMet)-specific endonuclease VapC